MTDLTPSNTLRRAMRKELERFARERERLLARQGKLQDELAALVGKLRELDERESLLRTLEGDVADDEAELVSIEGGEREVLKGAAIRERAARRFYLTHGAAKAMHYRVWFELLMSEGVEITGRDPMATLLTNLTRSPVVERGDETATYLINAQAPEQLQVELAEAEAELRDLNQVLDRRDHEQREQLLDHRAELVSRARRLEGLLAEAERVLAPAEEGAGDPELRAAA